MNEAASAGREESVLATVLTSVALGSQREVVIHKEDVLFALSPKWWSINFWHSNSWVSPSQSLISLRLVKLKVVALEKAEEKIIVGNPKVKKGTSTLKISQHARSDLHEAGNIIDTFWVMRYWLGIYLLRWKVWKNMLSSSSTAPTSDQMKAFKGNMPALLVALGAVRSVATDELELTQLICFIQLNT